MHASWVSALGAAVAAALALQSAFAQQSASDAANERRVTLLHVNDNHGRYDPIMVEPGNATAQTGDPGRKPQSFERTGSVGGFARIARAVSELRATLGAVNVLLLHGGDAFGDDLLGNRTRGEAVIRLMNAVGFDFMALGNHDFDYGLERTRELQAIARFPMRGANVLDAATGKPFLGEPSRVFDVGGVKVAVLALGYHNTAETGSRDNVRGLRFTSGIDAARALVPALRERADAVVVLSHQGLQVDRELAKRVSGIDVIVGAHSHDFISPPQRVGSTWIAQALSDGTALGEITLTFDAARKLTGVAGGVHVLWTDIYPVDGEVAAQIDALRAPHATHLEAVVATAGERIGRRYRSESPFDVLVGEILRERTAAEVAFLPGVGYGVSLEPGPMTREALYTLLPHPNKIVTMELSGRQILEVLEQSARNQQPSDPLERVGGLVQTAGMKWTIDLSRPAGERVREVLVGALPLEPSRYYRVVTHNGMQQGLHRYTTFKDGRNTVKTDDAVTDVVEAALRKRGTVRMPAIGNVILIPAEG